MTTSIGGERKSCQYLIPRSWLLLTVSLEKANGPGRKMALLRHAGVLITHCIHTEKRGGGRARDGEAVGGRHTEDWREEMCACVRACVCVCVCVCVRERERARGRVRAMRHQFYHSSETSLISESHATPRDVLKFPRLFSDIPSIPTVVYSLLEVTDTRHRPVLSLPPRLTLPVCAMATGNDTKSRSISQVHDWPTPFAMRSGCVGRTKSVRRLFS